MCPEVISGDSEHGLTRLLQKTNASCMTPPSPPVGPPPPPTRITHPRSHPDVTKIESEHFYVSAQPFQWRGGARRHVHSNSEFRNQTLAEQLIVTVLLAQ